MAQTAPDAWIERALALADSADVDGALFAELPDLHVRGCGTVRAAQILLGLIAMAQQTDADTRGEAFDAVWPLDGLDHEHTRGVTLSLYRAWFHAQMPASGVWVHAFAFRFPSARLVDALMVRLTEVHDGAKQRRLVDALGWMEIPEAFYQLNHFAESDLIRSHTVHAFSVAEKSRERFGYTDPEFQDMCMPTLGLDARSRRELDYGPRTVTMRYVAGEVVFEDSKGKTFKNLPRARKTDDADKVAALREELQPALKIFRENHKRAAVRLERDMNEDRRWDVRHVRGRVLTHPIVSRLLHGLVWNLADWDEPPVFARPDEEGQFIGLDLEPVSLEGVEVIRIAKPTALGDQLMPWVEHFEDFELVQPIEQLSAARFMPGSPLIAEMFREVAAGDLTLDIRTIRRLHKDGVLGLEGHNDYTTPYVSVRVLGSGYEFVAHVPNLKGRWSRKNSKPLTVVGLGRRYYSGSRWNRHRVGLIDSPEALEALESCPDEEVVTFFKTLAALRATD